MLNRGQMTSQADLLTSHDLAHIVGKTIDDLKSLRCCRPCFVLRELVQSLKYCLGVTLAKKLLDKYYCVSLRKALHHIRESRLTRSPLLNLFGRKGKGGK